MKKLFAIAFTCVYLLLTVGVKAHYCMGRINSPASFREAKIHNSHKAEHKYLKNSPAFFISSDLYSEALVVFIA